MRKSIVGGKSSKLQATAIINPNSNKLEVSKERIKEITLKHCIDTLKNNEVEEEFRKEIETKRKITDKVSKMKIQGILGK